MCSQTSTIWLTLSTSGIISHFCHLFGHLCCHILSTFRAGSIYHTNGLCCSEVSLLLYSSPKCMTHSSCLAKIPRVIHIGRSLWRAPVQSLIKAEPTSVSEVAAQGPALMRFENLQGFIQRLTSPIMKSFFLMFSLNFPNCKSQRLHLVL